MQHLEASGAVRHIYIYIYVIRRLKGTSMSVTVHFLSLDIPLHTSASKCK